MMRLFYVLFLSLFLTNCFAQFGLAEREHLNRLADYDEVSLIVKGDLNDIKRVCKALKIRFKYGYQDLASISIEKSKLPLFYAALDEIQIEIPLAKGRALMDTALIHNNINQVHAGLSPLLQSYTGKNVVIGILDSGIYFEHEDFKNADGTSRIKFIWDQNVNSPINPPAPYGYGNEWTWIDIDNGACNHVEPANQFGHGTTVAGAACGNGFATGTHSGVAPDCDIIAVAVDYYDQDFLTNTVDAIDYVFKKADALGKPCVINTSIGTYVGSHDGKDVIAQLIDAMIEERNGRSLVASAGNGNNINNFVSNFTPAHLGYSLSTDTNFTWFRNIPNLNQIYFDLWSDTTDFNNAFFSIGNDDASTFNFRSRTPFLSIADFIGDLQQGVYSSTNLFDIGNNFQGLVEFYLEETERRYHLEVLITPTNVSDYWRLSLTGSGQFDLWSSQDFQGTSNMVYSNLPPNFVLPDIDFYKLPDNQKSIVSSWQCSDKVITVGNFANKGFYYDVDSIYRSTNLTPGEIYYSSSEGPSRDGRLKPDISATGNIIFASGNANFIASALSVNRPKVAPGAKHNFNGGTSMSSPIVAGAVALYLEKNPSAWWYEIKEALTQTALKDSYTGPAANNIYGHGKLNGFELLKFDAIFGCMDDTMFNYNPNANIDDGSCIPVAMGCTDSTALNYSANANTDDGSCIPIVYGCTDSSATNYDSTANVDDGTCTYPVDTTGLLFLPFNDLFSSTPNPAKDFVRIKTSFKIKESYFIEITNLLGATVVHAKLTQSEQRISIRGMGSGVYLINLMDQQQILASEKLIIE